MMKTLIATCALIAAACCHQIQAQELTFGSKAPKLEVSKFVKGDEVKSFEKGKIYVVELWATWCPPCRETIPHLTELQKRYEDIVIIGVSVLERNQDLVPEFVEKMGKKMDYRVAIDQVPEGEDAEEGKTVKNWMVPAGLEGIPYAFIVNGEGKIAWIGSPFHMEEPLEKIVAGKWDLVAEAKKIAEEKALQMKLLALQEKLQKLLDEFTAGGDPDELLTSLEAAEKEVPERALAFEMKRFEVLSLIKERSGDAFKVAQSMLKSEKGDDPQVLNNIAWILVTPDRETKADSKLLKLALQVALKADDLTNGENASVKDTLAKAYFDNGDLAKAVKTQESALVLLEGTKMAQDASLKKRLRLYRRALEAASTSSKTGDDAGKNQK